ncbi:MAG: DMT family transporter [Geminicoccaceae bacterium]
MAVAPRLLLLFAAVTLFWGLNWPAMKVAVTHIDPWAFRSFVLVFSALALFAIARLMGHKLLIPGAYWSSLLLPSLANVTGWHLFSAFGLTYVGGGRAAIIAFTMPIWAALLSVLWLDEKLAARHMAGLGLGFAAVLLLTAADMAAFAAAPLGLVLMLAAAMSWALGTVSTKAVDWPVPAVVLTAWQLSIGCIPVLIYWLATGSWSDFQGVPADAWASMLYCTFIAMVFCFCSFVYLVTKLPATIAAIGTLAIPIVGLASSAWLLAEPVGPFDLAALIAVVAALALVMIGPRPETVPAR